MIFKPSPGSGCRGPNLEETAMKSITRLVIAAATVFALAALRPAHEHVKPTDLGSVLRWSESETIVKNAVRLKIGRRSKQDLDSLVLSATILSEVRS